MKQQAKLDLHEALVELYEGERKEAEERLLECYNNPSGIGKHPNVIGQWGRPKAKMAKGMKEMVDTIVNANKCLTYLKSYKKKIK